MKERKKERKKKRKKHRKKKTGKMTELKFQEEDELSWCESSGYLFQIQMIDFTEIKFCK